MINVLLKFLLQRNINSETSGKLKNSWHWLTISSKTVAVARYVQMLAMHFEHKV